MITALLSSEFLSDLLLKVLKYLFKKYRNKAVKSLTGENGAGKDVIRSTPGNETAVVFIHGFGGNAKETWGSFPKLVSDDPNLKNWDVISLGYNTGLMPDIRGLWSGKPDIQKLADYLRTTITSDFSAKYKRIVLVAHSMGGLVTQRALLDLPSADRVRLIHGVVLFGTPSLGLRKAQFGRIINRQIRDLGQESVFIGTLRQNWTTEFKDGFSFNFLTVAGDLDEFVPAQSALTPFAPEYQKITAGNHVDIVKPTDANHLSFQILKNFLENNHYQAPTNSAAVAIELGKFKDALLTLEPVKADLDARGQVNYALALVGVGKEEEAIKYLSKATEKPNTDVMGTLGGRYKRRWLVNSTQSDAEQALELYQGAYTIASNPATFKPEQVYYHAINLAFLHLLYKDDLAQAQSFANIAIEHCEHQLSTNNLWKWATLGEAYLYLQDGDQAFDYYKKALETEPLPSQRDAMYLHWHPLTKRMGLKETEKKLELLFYSFG